VARLDHAAVWTADLERLRTFYERYLDARAGPLYENPAHGFRSYFLDLGGVRLELMQMATVGERPPGKEQRLGFAHLAFALGSEEAVDALTVRLADDGYTVLDAPRRTGDGYYESVVADPDGNRLELTV
jgi:lactoylglutathione lyase